MKAYLKIDKSIKDLNFTELYTYIIICRANLNKQEITRAYIAKCLDVENLDYVSQVVKNLESTNLIKREYTYSNNLKTGHINQSTNYIYVNPKTYFTMNLNLLFNLGLNRKSLAFLLKLRTLAFDDTLDIKYNRKEISDILGISYKGVCKYIKELEASKVLVITDSAFHLNEEYFPVREINHLSEENKSILNEILSKNDPNSRLYKQAIYFKENGLDLIPSANKVFEDMLDGFWGIK